MADFAFQRETRTQGQIVDRVFVSGQEAEFIFGKGTQVLPNLPVPIYSVTSQRLVVDDVGEWFEVGFQIDSTLTGNAAAGYADSGNYFRIDLQQSFDLATWNAGSFIPATVPVVSLGGGVMQYWARSTVPRIWKYVTIDLTLTSDRHNKSITMLNLFGVNITAGMSYPYVMPAQAATLQAHLIAAGYPGTVVSSVAKSMSVIITNWTNGGADNFEVTLSGSNVTMVKNGSGTNISLAYPYAMPAQVTNLQAALISAGYPYASARVFGDEWTIFIPNRNAIFSQRQFGATISPYDPYTYQGPTGTGTDAGATVDGASGNVRATSGLTPLPEAGRQFARLKITSGSRYDAIP